MGPMGNYMTLLQLARGRGGYGGGMGRYGGFGPSGGNMYGAAGQMAGMYGAPPPGAFGPSGGNMMGAAGQMAGAAPSPGQGTPQYAPATFPGQGAGEGWGWQQGAGPVMEGSTPQASGMRPITAEGMSGAADANMQALQAAYGNQIQAAAPQENTIQGAPQGAFGPVSGDMYGAAAAMTQGNPYMNTAYNPMGLRGGQPSWRRRFY